MEDKLRNMVHGKMKQNSKMKWLVEMNLGPNNFF